MSLGLNNDTTQSFAPQLVSPVFFSDILTGKGKKAGFLNIDLNPINIKIHQTIPYNYTEYFKYAKQSFGNSEQVNIPIAPIPYTHNLDDYTQIYVSNLNNYIDISNTDSNTKIYYKLEPIHIKYIKNKKTESLSLSKDKIVTFMQKILIKNNNSNIYEPFTNSISDTNINYFEYSLCINPIEALQNLKLGFINDLIDFVKLENYLYNYSTYEEVLNLANKWINEQDILSDDYIQTIKLNENIQELLLKNYISYLNNYNIPLEKYRHIYENIKNNIDYDILKKVVNNNLNILLSDILNDVKNNRKDLTSLQKENIELVNPECSISQKNAIITQEPLTLIQAAAGTGKSYTLTERISYLKKLNIKPEEILVMSFSNAAATNMDMRNPGIKSTTIASMLHSIYELNFPKHRLSNMDTIINSLSIYFGNNQISNELKVHLENIKNLKNNAYTELNIFIEKNYDTVINILNTIKQTTLEIESIICYLKINELKEPKGITPKFIIVDEVQDNAIMEFIYTLKYTIKHKANLLVVGDASQTLYEFRAANPRALMMLETSELFDIHKLQTNYRSNQEILNFANILLDNIHANSFSKLKLKANRSDKVTKSSIKDKIKLKCYSLERLNDKSKELIQWLQTNDIRTWIEEKISNKEQIAFIAYTRDDVKTAEMVLQKIYPELNITNIIPALVKNIKIFSEYIKKHIHLFRFMNSNNLAMEIRDNITEYIHQTTSPKRPFELEANINYIEDWYKDNNKYIKILTTNYQNKKLNQKQLISNIVENLIEYEIKLNGLKQRLINQKNKDKKENKDLTNSNIILSTIHSVKGLEFDNTIILYRDEENMSEENKRMFYVAFTRAKSSEYIISYGSNSQHLIELEYNKLINRLTE